MIYQTHTQNSHQNHFRCFCRGDYLKGLTHPKGFSHHFFYGPACSPRYPVKLVRHEVAVGLMGAKSAGVLVTCVPGLLVGASQKQTSGDFMIVVVSQKKRDHFLQLFCCQKNTQSLFIFWLGKDSRLYPFFLFFFSQTKKERPYRFLVRHPKNHFGPKSTTALGAFP